MSNFSDQYDDCGMPDPCSACKAKDERIAQLDALVATYEAWTAGRGVTADQVAYIREKTAALYTDAEKDESVAAVLRRAGWLDYPGLGAP